MHNRILSNDTKLALIIPVLNEEANIDLIYSETKVFLDEIENLGIRVNWYFADNMSRDDTRQMILKLHEKDSRVKGFFWIRNYGVTSSVLNALRLANSDVSIVVDADGQEPAEMIQKLFEKWLEGYDLCYGIRAKRVERKRISLSRKMFKILARILGGNAKGDVESGCWLFDSSVVNDLLANPPSTDYLAGALSYRNYHSIGIEYIRKARRIGTSKFTFNRYLKYAFEGLFGDNQKLLRFSLVVALLNVAISIIILLWIFVAIILLNRNVQLGIFSLGVMINLLGVAMLFGIAIISEFVGRIFRSTSRIEVAICYHNL
jgi:glycosyltransferase involved in cell wall biosynthesis